MATIQEDKPRTSLEEEVKSIKAVDDPTVFEENTPEERKLLWKIDLYLMPTIWCLCLFSYMVWHKYPFKHPT